MKKQLAEGGLDETREFVESLAQEFDILDIAAAAIKMIHDGSEKAPVAPAPPQVEEVRGYEAKGGFEPRRSLEDRAPRSRVSGPMTLLRLSVGKEESIRPADLVGAIAGEAKISSSAIGAIKIHDDYSLVEIPDELAARVIAALKSTKIRGNKVTVQSKPAR